MDIFHADHQTCFAGNGGAVGQPAGAAAHGFGQIVDPRGFGIVKQVANLAGQRVDGGEIAEGEIDAGVIVIDGFRQMHDGNMLGAGGEAILKQFKFVGGFQRVVAAD